MKRRTCLLLFAFTALAAHSWANDVQRGEPLARKGAFGARLSAGNNAVAIGEVLPGGTADALKLRAGDQIKEINGTSVPQIPTFTAKLRRMSGGDALTLLVVRDGKEIKITGQLKPRPKQREDGFKVSYDQVVSRGKRIRVIATYPEGKGPFPTVMLIGGIGAYSVDADWETAPYGNIMGPIAKSGYATIRIDKPGQGDSEGPEYPDLMFDDEFDAYLQALKLAKTLPFVDPSRVGIFGHSMGGSFGPLLAAQEPVKCLMASATLGKTWFEYTLENTRRQSLLAGATAGQVDDQMRQLAPLFHYLFNEGKSPDQIKKDHPDLAPLIGELSPDGKTYSGVGFPFFQQLAKKNLMEAWDKTTAQKVLALWGENDFVSGEDDHIAIAAAVNKVRPGTAKFVKVPQSDHGFFKTTSYQDSMSKWGRPGAVFNDNIVTILKDWLKENL